MVVPEQRIAPLPVVPEGEVAVLVESDPPGAMVVVNGVPVGRAPRTVVLPVTAQGFARNAISIKVRFVAEESGQQSQTTEALLTPLDKMPACLVFTPSKVQRKR